MKHLIHSSGLKTGLSALLLPTLLIPMMLFLLSFSLVRTAQAQACSDPITVTNVADSGAGTLRQAIADLCANGEIGFDPALSGQSIVLTSGELVITKTLTIASSVPITIDGNNSSRIFNVTRNSSITLSGLTLYNGYAQGDSGGAIASNGGVTLRDSVVYSNAADFDGGGIYVRPGEQPGGFSIIRSQILSNTAQEGGGVYLNAGSRDASGYIFESTIANNRASLGGGGVSMTADSGLASLTMENSTVSGNQAVENGGGLYLPTGTIELYNVTVTDNVADAQNQDSGDGGGLADSGSNTTVSNSIIAGNRDSTTSGSQAPDIAGVFTSGGNNLIGDGSNGSGFTNGVNGDLVGDNSTPLDPLLGPLQDNGGPTPTHALLSGSPAIDAGNDSNALFSDFDQRSDGFNRISGVAVDIGAFELQFVPDVAVTKSVSASIAGPGQFITYTIAFSNTGNADAGNVVIRDSVPVSVTVTDVTSSTALIVEVAGAPDFEWNVAKLPLGETSVITLTALITGNSALPGTTFTNTAIITSSADSNTANNESSAAVTVPAVIVEVSPAAVDEDSASPLTYTFTRTSSSAAPLTVDFSVGGTATLSADYTQSGADSFNAAAGLVTIPAGQSAVTVTVTPISDADVEANETVVVTVTAGSGYGPGSPSVATGTITNDDFVVLAIAKTASSPSVNEGDPITYTVVVSNTGTGNAVDLTITDSQTGTLEAGRNLAAGTAVTYTYSLTTDDGPQTTVNTATLSFGRSALTATTTVNIVNVAPTATLTNSGPVDGGSTALVAFSGQSDPSAADTTAGFRYSYDFDNDNNFEISDVISPSVTVPATFLTSVTSRTVRGRIADKDGGFTDYTTIIQVNAPTPTATATATPITPTPTSTATATATPITPTPTSTATATVTPITPTPTHTATATVTPITPTPTHTATATATPITPTPTSTATATVTPITPTPTSTATATATPVTPTATATATVPVSAVAVDKWVSQPQSGVVTFGDLLTFTVAITNTGTTTLVEVPLEDIFDSAALGFTGASIAPDAVADGDLTWTDLTTSQGDLAPQQALTLTVHFTATGIFSQTTNLVAVTGARDQFDATLPPVVAQANVKLAALELIVVSNPPSGSQVGPGDCIVYDIRVRNVGGVDLTDVVITSSVPEDTTLVTECPGSARMARAHTPPQVYNLPILAVRGEFRTGFQVVVNGDVDQLIIENVTGASSAQTPDPQEVQIIQPFNPTALTLLSFTAQPSADGVAVAWVTGQEVDSFSFHLRRSSTADTADATRITGAAIPARGSGSRYTFLDGGGVLGDWYWLEETTTDGAILVYGPVRAGREGDLILNGLEIFLPMVGR